MTNVPAKLWVLLVLLACACAPERERPNILLVTLDTTRADHTSAYGYGHDTTPTLRALAAQGIRFATAYAPSSVTGPTHATLFTGLPPISHRLVKNGLPLAAAHVTLAERLGQAGWTTASFVSSFVMDPKFGWAQGFERYDAEFDPAESTIDFSKRPWRGHRVEGGFDRRADETTRRALAWLEGERDPARPFFLFVHYFDPHAPYRPPPEYARLFPAALGPKMSLPRAIARYDAEIAFTDAQLGVLLAGLERTGLAQDTLVVVTADHGEGLMLRGHMEHGLTIFEEQVRVPLIMRWPGRIEAGRVVEASPGQLIDLMPTLLDLASVPAADLAAGPGQSMAPLLLGHAEPDAARPVHLFRHHFGSEDAGKEGLLGQKYGVRVGDWKYVVGPEEGTHELYDLGSDPAEAENRVALEPEQVDRLAHLIETYRAEHTRTSPIDDAISDEDLERLRALGYVE